MNARTLAAAAAWSVTAYTLAVGIVFVWAMNRETRLRAAARVAAQQGHGPTRLEDAA